MKILSALLLIYIGLGMMSLQANDSAGAVGAGGIEFHKTEGIVMEKEDLFISPDLIKVSYVFKNITDQDKTVEIFFPIPLEDQISAQAIWDEEVIRDLKTQENENVPFSNFSVMINDQSVSFQKEVRALKEGKDITNVFKKHNLPLNSILARCEFPMEKIEDDEKCGKRIELYKNLHLMGSDGKPLWQKQVNYHWTQTFPAGQETKIEHSYRPARGFFFLVPNHSRPPMELLLEQTLFRGGWIESCPDRSFTGEGDLISWLVHQFQDLPASQSHCTLWIYEIDYILTTGNNWEGPIKNFTLTLEYPQKGMVSSCWNLDKDSMKKVKPNRLEFHQKDFKPDKDLKLFFAIPCADPLT
ncbi:MAG: DUF4424 family protein [Bacteriovorax sp.]|nr:DUF4424 family protein [Bacteriovorax sp.]